MAVRDDRSDVKQTTAGFRGPLMVQSLTSAKSKFLSLGYGLDPEACLKGWKRRISRPSSAKRQSSADGTVRRNSPLTVS